MNEEVRLIALDIDGVISRGMKSNFNYTILNILANINVRANKNPEYPAVTVITGRPQPYIEALLQVIKGFVPAVFEQGTGFYDPASYTVEKNPELKNTEAFYEMRQSILKEILPKNSSVSIQPGKEYTISIYSSNIDIHNNLKEMILELNKEWNRDFDFIYSSNCLNIIPKGFHKGNGITLLSDKTGVPLENILGVGDSDVDVPFLEKTGFSASPANGSDKIKKTANYISSRYYHDGLFEILDHFSLLP